MTVRTLPKQVGTIYMGFNGQWYEVCADGKHRPWMRRAA